MTNDPTEALQQELIIPRPRSISAEPDLDDLTDGEAHRLAREYLEERRVSYILLTFLDRC